MPKLIMVINDTQEILELFEIILTEAGYRVNLHSYGIQDLQQIMAAKPDLIISDHIPVDQEKLGWQFLQKLKMRRETQDIPVPVCTTDSYFVRQNEGWLKTKGIEVVIKPFIVDELLAAVERVIGKAEG